MSFLSKTFFEIYKKTKKYEHICFGLHATKKRPNDYGLRLQPSPIIATKFNRHNSQTSLLLIDGPIKRKEMAQNLVKIGCSLEFFFRKTCKTENIL